MSIRPCLIAMLALVAARVRAQAASPPDTPAGQALGAWLDAFNSGDSVRIDAFDKAHLPWWPLDSAMGSQARSGGYELLDIDKSGELWIIFGAKERANERHVVGRLVLDSGNPAVISRLHLSPDSTAPAIALSATERDRVIESAVRVLKESYVLPTVARRMAAALRQQQKQGAYRGISDGEIFSDRLTDDLLAVSHDRHLSVQFSPTPVPDGPISRPEDDPRVRKLLAANNCGFEKTERLAPNIGYLKLSLLGEPAICASAAIAAMNALADSATLIIDLRDTRGGAPGMVALICSYLFGEPTHLDDIYNREANTTEQSWTWTYVPGKRFTATLVFLLISGKTFSAGEEFSYDLKAHRRATLIGETTGGGAHLVEPRRLDDHFFIEVPFGRFISPVTGTDWEGTGVEPDVKTPAPAALAEAITRARE